MPWPTYRIPTSVDQTLFGRTQWCCPDCQRWGQQNREIVCPVKQQGLCCRLQKRWKKLCWVLKIDGLFCELAKMMERLIFDGEKNENNGLQSYYIAFTQSWKMCWLINFSFADACFCLHQSPTRCLFLELCCFCCFRSVTNRWLCCRHQKVTRSLDIPYIMQLLT